VVTGTFAVFGVRNYRRYALGLTASAVGAWMELTARVWLVLAATGAADQVGVVVAAQFVPMVLLAPYAGLIVDRMDTRRLMAFALVLRIVLSALLAALTFAGLFDLWSIAVISVVAGLLNTFDSVGRHAFVLDVVPREHVQRAVALNGVLNNLARAVGPAVAGLLIDHVATGMVFVLDAVFRLIAVAALVSLDRSTMTAADPVRRQPGQLRAGVRHVLGNRLILLPLLMVVLVGTFTFEFPVTLPVMAESVFHGSASTYGYMATAMGLGAIVGGLLVSAKGATPPSWIAASALVLGVLTCAVAVMPTLPAALVVLALVGAATVVFPTLANSAVQLGADPLMRGRVMGLWNVAYQGTTVVGALVIGLVAEHLGARWALAVGGVVAVVTGLAGWLPLRRAGSAA
jgi:MFS family permease